MKPSMICLLKIIQQKIIVMLEKPGVIMVGLLGVLIPSKFLSFAPLKFLLCARALFPRFSSLGHAYID